MSGTKLFVGNLSWNTSDDSLRSNFERFGRIVETKVIRDRETGRARGFGFITFETAEEATNALNNMDGQDLEGRAIRVSYPNNE